MNKVLSEVYACVMAMGEKYINRIPATIWGDIVARKDNDYFPEVDAHKPLGEQGFAGETIAFIAMLHRNFWCDNEEERERLLAIFEKNQAEWDEKVASIESVRGLIKIVHKD